MQLRDYIIPIARIYKFSGKRRSRPAVLIHILAEAGSLKITEGQAKSWLAKEGSSAYRNPGAFFHGERVNRERLIKLFNDKIGDSWRDLQNDYRINAHGLIDVDTLEKNVFFQSLVNELEVIFRLQSTSGEMVSGEQNKTIASHMCKYFESKYSVYQIDKFLKIRLEDKVDRILLGNVEQFIEVIKDNLLQPYSQFHLDDMAKVMYVKIREYIVTLEHYKNDLVRFFKKYGNICLPAYTTYSQPKIDSSDSISPLMRYSVDMAAKGIDIYLRGSQSKVQEMNTVDSIEHNRKNLYVLYRQIVSMD